MKRKLLIGVVLAMLTAMTAQPALASDNVIMVDIFSLPVPNDTICTLSEALDNVNNGDHSQDDCDPGSTTDPNVIAFGGSGLRSILTGDLVITRANTKILGDTTCGGPCVVLDGSGGGTNLLTVQASGVTISGMTLTNANGYGLVLQNADNALVQSSWIGTSNGTNPAANINGIKVDSSDNVTIQNNVISGNSQRGIHIINGSAGTAIKGNLIGVSASGEDALGNGTINVEAFGAGATTIGGVVTGTGNVISASGSQHGIQLASGGSGSEIKGNLIGTNSTGTVDLGNALYGIWLTSTPGVIVEGNVISGNNAGGVGMLSSSGAVVRDNIIGLNESGTAMIGNSEDGIIASGTLVEITINTISGNGGAGIHLTGNSANSVIKGNRIGTNASGTVARGNAGDGIYIESVNTVTVGGSGEEEPNLISGNGGYGVNLHGGNNITVTDNLIGTDARGTGSLPNNTGSVADAGVIMSNGATATIANNLIAHHPSFAISLDNSIATFNSGSTNNCLIGNAQGLNNATGFSVTFEDNWWDSPTGPTAVSNPSGTGETVVGDVDLDPFLTTAPSVCSFLYGTPPLLSAPKNGAAVAKTPVKLAWKKVKGATSYALQLDEVPSFSSPTVPSGTLTGTSFTTSSLSFGTYYWRVAMVGPNGQSDYSLAFSFEVTLNKTPAKGAQVPTHLPKFAWNTVTGASEYHLQIYDNQTDCDNATNAVLERSATKPAYALTATDGALDFGTYFWRVQQSQPSIGPNTRCWPFELTSLKTPKHNGIVTSFLPKFTWAKNVAATSYTISVVKIADDDSTSPVFTDKPVPAALYTALPGDGFTYGHYGWTIKEVGSTFSNPTPYNEFYITNMIKPANNTVITDTTPSFSWGKVTGATAYTLEVTTTDDTDFASPVVSMNMALGLKATTPVLARGVYLWRVVVAGSPNYSMPAWTITIGP